jgi:pyrroline-5-carboxylate reductase
MSAILYEPPVVGLIGLGHLGNALLEGIFNHTPHMIRASDVRPIILSDPKFSRIPVMQDNRRLAKEVGVLILAVRPQDMEQVLDEISDFTGLIITFAAGLPLQYYSSRVREATIVRAMTNLSIAYGQGMTAWVTSAESVEEDVWIANALFSDLGNCIRVAEADESHLDVVTALSEKDAELTVLETVKGLLALYRHTDLSLDEIVSSVASQGGTTEAGLQTMRAKGLETALKQGLEDTISKCKDLADS